jgi:hypothetical protein
LALRLRLGLGRRLLPVMGRLRPLLKWALAGVPILAFESRVLRLHPLSAVSARMSAAYSLRDDPLQAQLTGFDEHERSLGHQDVAEQDVVHPGDER